MKIKDRQEINRKRKLEKIKQAEEAGAVEMSARLMSAIYILHSESAILYDDLDELLEEHGLKIWRIKGLGETLNKAFDEYFKGFSKLVSDGQNLNWAKDIDRFDKMFREFSGLIKD